MLEQTSREELFDRANPELDENDARKVKALIRRILQYDPAKRPSPAEILLDPWFGKGARQIDCSVLYAFLVVQMVREEHFEHCS